MNFMRTVLQGLAITALTLSVASPVLSAQAEHSDNTHMSQLVPVISFVNYQEAYSFTVFLNEEPMVSGTGLLLFDWSGYPIRTGTNAIRFEAVALADNAATPVYGRINLSGPAQKEIAVIRDSCRGSNTLVNEFQFELPSDSAVSNSQHDLIPSNIQTISNQLTKLSILVIETIRSREANQMSTLLNMSLADTKSKYPVWFFDIKQKVEITSISDAGDLDLVFGQRFVMVRPRYAYLKKHPRSGICDVTNSSTGSQVTMDCLLFCRSNGKWRWLRSDGTSVVLPTVGSQ